MMNTQKSIAWRGLLLALLTSVAALAQNGHDLLQKALRKERVEGDLKGAIDLYQQIVNANGANRALVAQALVQMGKGYEKLGAAQARAAYERVISEYSDQAREVAEARERLKTLGALAQVNGAPGQPVVRLAASDKVEWVAFGPHTRPSPDGRYLSYINWEHGNLALYNVATGERRDLTTEGTWSGKPNQFSWDGIWSPDSTQVAYLWSMGGKGELRIVHRDGGKPKTLVPARLWPQSWSKDGRRILVVSEAGSDSSEKEHAIQLVDALSGEGTMVKQLSNHPGEPEGAGDAMIASLSPDGKFIAYSHRQPGSGSTSSAPRDIRIISTDGTNDRILIEHPANDWTPHWMPGGKHLLFGSDRSGKEAIWMLPVSQGQKAGEPRMICEMSGRLLGSAEDGTVFYSAQRPSFNIYVAEADWDSATLGTPKLVSLRHDGKNRNPRWSSDGARLGYLSLREPSVLVFQDVATGKEQDVEADLQLYYPVWSPDLSRLVGTAKSPTQKGNGLFEVEVKSGRRTIVQSLAEPNDDTGYPLFTPDGKHLIYSKFSWTGGREPDGLVELDLVTRRERQITPPRTFTGYNRQPAISPDGSRLATCKNPYPEKPGDKIQLMVASRADGVIKTVAEFPISEKPGGQVYAWLPDNRRVLVAFDGKQAAELFLVDTETGNSRPFGPPRTKGEAIQVLSIHPDGKRIAFDRGRMIREIWAMNHFLPEAKERLGALGAPVGASSQEGQALMHKIEPGKFARWAASSDSKPSPDGRYLAYVNWAFGNLALCDTHTGVSRDLTTEGTWEPPDQFASGAVWSPDSEHIAYTWYKGEAIELRVVHRDGGTPRVLVPFETAEGIWAQSWSQDGRFLIGLAPMKKWPKGAKRIFQIVRVDASTGTVAVVKELPDANGSVNVALSPDGRHIAYNFPAGQLRVVNVDGSNDHLVIEQPSGAGQLVWMPDGKDLIFVSARSGTQALWALPMDQGNAAGRPRLVRDGFFHSTILGSTDDGTLCWFTSTPRANIFTAETDFSSGTMQPPRHVSARFDGRSRHPRWSQDGTELTYVSRRFPGAPAATHVIREATSGSEREIEIPADGYWGPPQWSADLRTLYGRVMLKGQSSWGLYAFNAQTGQPSLISGRDNAGWPNPTPDGKHLIYLRGMEGASGDGAEIVERDLASGQERVIRHSAQGSALTKMNSMVCLNPLLSRDSSRLAFLEKQGTNAVLQIVSRADGASKTVWETATARPKILDWLPNDREVLISFEENADGDDKQQLKIVDTETRAIRPFGESFQGDAIIYQVSIHPDGKRVVFSRGGAIAELWTMKSFLAKSER